MWTGKGQTIEDYRHRGRVSTADVGRKGQTIDIEEGPAQLMWAGKGQTIEDYRHRGRASTADVGREGADYRGAL